MGGLEALGAVIKESMESHAMVFNDVAHAIESVATSLDRIATALDKPTKPTKPNKPKT
jgi:hypothetical protein